MNDQQYFSLKKIHLVILIVMFFAASGVQVGMTISRIDGMERRLENLERTIAEITRLNTQIELLRKDLEYLQSQKTKGIP
jgi:hypothetical protein